MTYKFHAFVNFCSVTFEKDTGTILIDYRYQYPAGNYMFKVNNRNTRAKFWNSLRRFSI